MSFSVLDIGLGILILLFLVRGLLRGLVQEIAGFLGLFLGLFVAGRYYTQLAPQFSGIINSPKMAAGISYALIFIAVLIVVALGATVVRRFMDLTFTAWIDNILGGIIGAVKGVFVCAIGLAIMQRFVPDSPFLKHSVLAPYIDSLIVFARSLLPAFLESGI